MKYLAWLSLLVCLPVYSSSVSVAIDSEECQHLVSDWVVNFDSSQLNRKRERAFKRELKKLRDIKDPEARLKLLTSIEQSELSPKSLGELLEKLILQTYHQKQYANSSEYLITALGIIADEKKRIELYGNLSTIQILSGDFESALSSYRCWYKLSSRKFPESEDWKFAKIGNLPRILIKLDQIERAEEVVLDELDFSTRYFEEKQRDASSSFNSLMLLSLKYRMVTPFAMLYEILIEHGRDQTARKVWQKGVSPYLSPEIAAGMRDHFEKNQVAKGVLEVDDWVENSVTERLSENSLASLLNAARIKERFSEGAGSSLIRMGSAQYTILSFLDEAQVKLVLSNERLQIATYRENNKEKVVLVQKTHAVDFPIPKEARAKGIEGKVVIFFEIKKNGKTRKHKILSSSNNLFDMQTIKQAKNLRYKFVSPKKLQVNASHNLEVIYSIKDEGQRAASQLKDGVF